MRVIKSDNHFDYGFDSMECNEENSGESTDQILEEIIKTITIPEVFTTLENLVSNDDIISETINETKLSMVGEAVRESLEISNKSQDFFICETTTSTSDKNPGEKKEVVTITINSPPQKRKNTPDESTIKIISPPIKRKNTTAESNRLSKIIKRSPNFSKGIEFTKTFLKLNKSTLVCLQISTCFGELESFCNVHTVNIPMNGSFAVVQATQLIEKNKIIGESQGLSLTEEEFFNLISPVERSTEIIRGKVDLNRSRIKNMLWKLLELQAKISGYLTLYTSPLLLKTLNQNLIHGAWRYRGYLKSLPDTTNPTIIHVPFGDHGFRENLQIPNLKFD